MDDSFVDPLCILLTLLARITALQDDFAPVPLTENRTSLSRMPLQPSAAPSQPSSRSDSLERDTIGAFINFYSDRTEYSIISKLYFVSNFFAIFRLIFFPKYFFAQWECEKEKKRRSYLSTFGFKKRNAIFQRNGGAFALTHQQFRSLQTTTTMPSTTTGMIPGAATASVFARKAGFLARRSICKGVLYIFLA